MRHCAVWFGQMLCRMCFSIGWLPPVWETAKAVKVNNNLLERPNMCKDVALEARNKKCFRSQILQLCLAEGIAATKLLELVDDLVWWNSRNPCCNCRPLHVWIWNYKQLPANHVFASHCTPAFASQTATHSYTPFKRHANTIESPCQSCVTRSVR